MGQDSVQALAPIPFGRNWGRVKMGALAEGMDSGVCSAGAMDTDFLTGKLMQGPFQAALDSQFGLAGRLQLPASVAGALVGQRKQNTQF